jgi:BirA family biotin operon repressor/biotin-[acetyl-CoA-carboxylase] ligase
MESLSEFLILKERTESTNDDLRELVRAGEARPGTIVLAEHQSAGRGRKGAEWFCEEGKGLAFSVALEPKWPKQKWGWMSLASGLAVAEVLEGFGFAPQIKWPNDLLLEGRKCCGILVEAPADLVVVGVGINVNGTSFPDEFEATSLELAGGAPFSREMILQGIWTRLRALAARTPETVSEEVWNRLAWRDQPVQTIFDGTTRTGTIRGFGENGELVIQSGADLLKISEAGSVRPVPD